MALSRRVKKVAENGKEGRKSRIMRAITKVGIASIFGEGLEGFAPM
jgi:hypothetical protein